MKFSEFMVDALMKTSLFEMAFSKADALRRARNLQFQIAKHLIKVKMYSQSEHVNHWCGELNAWLHEIQDILLKGTNKPLQYDDLYKILLIEPMESPDEVQERMNTIYRQNEKLHIDEIDARIVHLQIEDILNNVCHAIASRKFTDIREYL